MIETEQAIAIDAGIDAVWSSVRAIESWASLMPGYQSCEILGEDDSCWTLKVGAGGLVRTVRVLVHVDRWDGPGGAAFTFRLERDPVEGSGTYRAVTRGARETEVTLAVGISGTGPMAPMWEALGKPLLPQFAKAFAQQLKARIEEGLTEALADAPSPAPPLRIGRLTRLWRAIFGTGKQAQA